MGRETFIINKEKYTHLPPYDLLYQGIDLKRELEEYGIKLLVPKILLHGTQRREEYDNLKRKQVEYAFATQGVNFLLQNPVIGCVLIDNNLATLAVLDGHHRTRYAALYNIKDIPILLCQPKDVVNVLNKHEKQISEEEFINEINRDINLAIHSFSIRYPRYSIPKSLLGVSRFEDLSLRFKIF